MSDSSSKDQLLGNNRLSPWNLLGKALVCALYTVKFMASEMNHTESSLYKWKENSHQVPGEKKCLD